MKIRHLFLTLLIVILLRIRISGAVVLKDGGEFDRIVSASTPDTRYRYNTLDLDEAEKRRDEQLYEVSVDLGWKSPITLDESQLHRKHEHHDTIRDRPHVYLCCEPGLYLKNGECVQGPSQAILEFPPIYLQSHRHLKRQSDHEIYLMSSNKSADWHFRSKIYNPCDDGAYGLYPGEDKFYLLDDGHVLDLEYEPENRDQSQFCLATLLVPENKNDSVMDNETYSDDLVNSSFRDVTVIAVCLPPLKSLPWIYTVFELISAVFLTLALFAYASLPHLQNLKGVIVSSYVMCLALAYYFLVITKIAGADVFVDVYAYLCNTIAYIVHFSFLASFFWLNVMCFDIWWTFGGFRSLHGSVKQRERKKFIMYSIYAWGCASILTGTCMIMDLMPGIPKNFIRPEFGVDSCWFHTAWARALYFYIPMGLTIICNICLFILTALKISMHKKDTARQLKGSDSRRHDDNKQWFNLYLKLFIVMGINWSMEIISWLVKDKRFKYIWFITDLTNTLQGVIIFIIFVWKDKIKRLLMKRFGCENGILSRNSVSKNGLTTNVTSSAVSKTTCVTSAGAPLHEKVNPFTDPFRPGGKSNANANATTTTNTTLCISENTNGDVKDGVV